MKDFSNRLPASVSVAYWGLFAGVCTVMALAGDFDDHTLWEWLFVDSFILLSVVAIYIEVVSQGRNQYLISQEYLIVKEYHWLRLVKDMQIPLCDIQSAALVRKYPFARPALNLTVGYKTIRLACNSKTRELKAELDSRIRARKP